MLTQSRRFFANLPLARWLVRVEWSPDAGMSWLPCTYVAGSPSADASSQTRWSVSLTLRDLDVSRDGFSLFATRVRMFAGLAFDADDVEWCPLGVFLAQSLQRSDADPDQWSFTGVGLEQVVIDDVLMTARSILAGRSGRDVVQQLVSESMPGTVVNWRVPADVSLPVMTADRGSSRWDLIDGGPDSASVAKSLGAEVFFDANGACIVAPVGSLGDEPVWTFDTGDDGVTVEVAESLDATGVVNCISVRGVADDGTPAVGPVFLADTDPTSPTRISLRRKGTVYDSPAIKTAAQAITAGSALLAPNLGLRQQVTVTAVFNPALEPGDVVAVRMPSGLLVRHIIDRITFDLEGGTMTLETRSALTALVASPVSASTFGGSLAA